MCDNIINTVNNLSHLSHHTAHLNLTNNTLSRHQYNTEHMIKSRNFLRILSWNIQSRNCSIEGNKFKLPEFAKTILENDIVCLQETKGIVKFENYRCFNNNRPSSNSGGGVAILINNRLASGITKCVPPKTSDAIAVKLSKHFFHSTDDIFIVCAYVSPTNS